MIQEKYFYTISPDINGIKKKKSYDLEYYWSVLRKKRPISKGLKIGS